MTTKRERERQTRLIYILASLGFTDQETAQMRRISNTLQNWFELECGNNQGFVERDPETEKPYFVREGRANTPANRRPIPDRETGARRRLAAIMASHPHLQTYIQTDPRGAALYILRPDDVPAGKDPAAYYSRGICVY
jgi:hypothetical protein